MDGDASLQVVQPPALADRGEENADLYVPRIAIGVDGEMKTPNFLQAL